MKKTLFVTMLAAALMGGQVFSAVVDTYIEGTYTEKSDYFIIGGVLKTDSDATGGNLTLQEDARGRDLSDWQVVGGGTITEGTTANSYLNKVTMKGGEVYGVSGGLGMEGHAYSNTAIVTGGEVGEVYGGVTMCEQYTGNAYGNVVIIAGSASAGDVYGGYSMNGSASGNEVHLVGAGIGLVAVIADAAGNTEVFRGGTPGMYVGQVHAGCSESGQVENNSIDIYGYGIDGAVIDGMDHLNFHLVDELANPDNFALDVGWDVNLDQLDIGGLAVYGEAVYDWSAFDGKTITLIKESEGTHGIITATKLPQEDIPILNVLGNVLATGKLALSEDSKQLQMTVHYSGVPEPATGTLGLLALAALCIRRRK